MCRFYCKKCNVNKPRSKIRPRTVNNGCKAKTGRRCARLWDTQGHKLDNETQRSQDLEVIQNRCGCSVRRDKGLTGNRLESSADFRIGVTVVGGIWGLNPLHTLKLFLILINTHTNTHIQPNLLYISLLCNVSVQKSCYNDVHKQTTFTIGHNFSIFNFP